MTPLRPKLFPRAIRIPLELRRFVRAVAADRIVITAPPSRSTTAHRPTVTRVRPLPALSGLSAATPTARNRRRPPVSLAHDRSTTLKGRHEERHSTQRVAQRAARVAV